MRNNNGNNQANASNAQPIITNNNIIILFHTRHNVSIIIYLPTMFISVHRVGLCEVRYRSFCVYLCRLLFDFSPNFRYVLFHYYYYRPWSGATGRSCCRRDLKGGRRASRGSYRRRPSPRQCASKA